jgi:hypothetical protein
MSDQNPFRDEIEQILLKHPRTRYAKVLIGMKQNLTDAEIAAAAAAAGREDELKASGQLEQLAASFARLDPPPAGTRRQVAMLGHFAADTDAHSIVSVTRRGRHSEETS